VRSITTSSIILGLSTPRLSLARTEETFLFFTKTFGGRWFVEHSCRTDLGQQC